MSLRRKVLVGGAYLAGRQGAGTLLNLVAVVLLTRLLGPRDWGLYAAALGIYVFAQMLTQWGIGIFLVRRQEEVPDTLYHQASSALLVLGLLGAAGAWAALPLLEAWTGLEALGGVGLLLFLVLPVHHLGAVPLARLERALDFRSVAGIELASQLVFLATAVPLALLGHGPFAPAFGWLAQQASLAGLAYAVTGYRPRWRWAWADAREMVGYGLGYSASIWVWQLRRLVNPLLVGRFLGAEAVGIVALATQVVSNLTFVSTATWRLSMAALARVQDDTARLRRALSEGMRLQTLAAGPLLVGFAVAAPLLVPLVFGDAWLPMLDVYPFIAVAYLAFAVFNLHSSALYVLKRNWDVTLYHVAHTGLLAGSAWLLLPRLGVVGYGWAELITLAGYPVIHFYTARSVGSPDYRAALPLVLAFVPALFWLQLGGWALLSLLLVPLWPGTLTELRGLVRSLRGLAYGG